MEYTVLVPIYGLTDFTTHKALVQFELTGTSTETTAIPITSAIPSPIVILSPTVIPSTVNRTIYGAFNTIRGAWRANSIITSPINESHPHGQYLHWTLWKCHEDHQNVTNEATVHYPVFFGKPGEEQMLTFAREFTSVGITSEKYMITNPTLWFLTLERMMAIIDSKSDVHPIDCDVIVEIVKLQMTKELWYYMLLCPVGSQPPYCVADIYWDQIIDSEGNPSMTIIALIVCLFYEWCQKSLQMNLDKTGNTMVIKIYSRILCIMDIPLDKINDAARDLAFIKDFNVYGVNKDGKCRRMFNAILTDIMGLTKVVHKIIQAY
ncbi:hypothetical protein BDR05DRAFT_943323 [Suillus weaverae]|nr:hypothetical protein BDR05DRAFT_943323 [Suillus weaverae]